MSGKRFYADEIYRDKAGKYYTRMAAEHCGYKNLEEMELVPDPPSECVGKTVRCEYSQIFYPNSALLLCNRILEVDENLYENSIGGDIYQYFDEDGNEVTAEDDFVEQQMYDVYQYFLLDARTAERLCRHTDELIFYSEELDLPVLAVTHWGTGWDYVETDFKY